MQFKTTEEALSTLLDLIALRVALEEITLNEEEEEAFLNATNLLEKKEQAA